MSTTLTILTTETQRARSFAEFLKRLGVSLCPPCLCGSPFSTSPRPLSYFIPIASICEMITRWIWLVPSTIWRIFACRIHFSTGYSRI